MCIEEGVEGIVRKEVLLGGAEGRTSWERVRGRGLGEYEEVEENEYRQSLSM